MVPFRPLVAGPGERPECREDTLLGKDSNPFVLAGIGALNATCWLAGIAVGWLIDSHLHTIPLFILLGLLAGAGLGGAATYKEVRRYLSQ